MVFNEEILKQCYYIIMLCLLAKGDHSGNVLPAESPPTSQATLENYEPACRSVTQSLTAPLFFVKV